MTRDIYDEFVARVKIISGLRIDERIVPQDGRLTMSGDLDVRVTIVASYYGESIVMRLLRRTAKVQTFSELGFSAEDQAQISQALKSRHGLILVTGPTGSGKTTTLYSLLALTDNADVSTVTIEDPVEYVIAHARQIQVQQKRGVNFVNGLRSILRQDPDVIMVGEIRDQETASMATSAALTGHLVFSTLHTNDALSTITRCVEMGIEPYLVAATLRLVISQRLVRKLCLNCRRVADLGESELLALEEYLDLLISQKNQPLIVYSAVGCEKCNGTGYSGRTVVSEILPMTDQLKQNVLEKKVTQGRSFIENNTIGHKAVGKYLQGVTSFEEIMKILHE